MIDDIHDSAESGMYVQADCTGFSGRCRDSESRKAFADFASSLVDGPMHGSNLAILGRVNSVILEATRLRGSCLWVHARLVCILSLHRANSLYDESWFVLIGKKNVHFWNVVIGTLRYIDHQSTRATSSENTSQITIDGNGCEIVGKEDPTSTHFNLETSLDRSGYGNDLETAFPKCSFVGQQLLAVGIKR
jgi:hypothetical protein